MESPKTETQEETKDTKASDGTSSMESLSNELDAVCIPEDEEPVDHPYQVMDGTERTLSAELDALDIPEENDTDMDPSTAHGT